MGQCGELRTIELGRPQTTVRRMRIAWWTTPKASNTHTHTHTHTHTQVCIIRIAFALQQWLHQRVSVSRYTYIARLFRIVTQSGVILVVQKVIFIVTAVYQ